MAYTLNITWSLKKEQKGDEIGTEPILFDLSLSTPNCTNAVRDDSFQICNRYMPECTHKLPLKEDRDVAEPASCCPLSADLLTFSASQQ